LPLDGIVYMSSITNAECVAVYDHAVSTKLYPACPAEHLTRIGDLVRVSASLNVQLRL